MRHKKKRKSRGFVLVIIEFVLAIAILLAILGVAAYFLCPLKKVTVEGTDLYTSKEVSEYILDDEGNMVPEEEPKKEEPKKKPKITLSKRPKDVEPKDDDNLSSSGDDDLDDLSDDELEKLMKENSI